MAEAGELRLLVNVRRVGRERTGQVLAADVVEGDGGRVIAMAREAPERVLVDEARRLEAFVVLEPEDRLLGVLPQRPSITPGEKLARSRRIWTRRTDRSSGGGLAPSLRCRAARWSRAMVFASTAARPTCTVSPGGPTTPGAARAASAGSPLAGTVSRPSSPALTVIVSLRFSAFESVLLGVRAPGGVVAVPFEGGGVGVLDLFDGDRRVVLGERDIDLAVTVALAPGKAEESEGREAGDEARDETRARPIGVVAPTAEPSAGTRAAVGPSHSVRLPTGGDG